MQEILLVFQIVIAVAMIGVILLQRSSADGLGLGGGGMGSFMSGRASANLLTKTTAILAALFILNSIVLAALVSNAPHQESILEKVEKKAAETPVKPVETKKQPDQKTKPSLPVAR
jgi:preprotein translocase subunit SecG